MIGIIGGVGPFAGLDLSSKIFSSTIAFCDQDHLTVILYSAPSFITDRTDFLTGKTNENPAEAVFQIVKEMVRMGVTWIGIPCNAMHAPSIFDRLKHLRDRSGIEVELVHMIEEVMEFMNHEMPKVSRVGVLSTTGTYQSGVYGLYLREFSYIPLIVPDTLQEEIHEAIYNKEYGIKACSDPVSEQALLLLKKGITWLEEKGAESIILGCSEISLAVESNITISVPFIDPTLILARALIKKSAPEKLKPLSSIFHS